MSRKIIVVSGGFDPVHSGHIDYIKASSLLGDMLIVALNSDSWLKKKKGNFFMNFSERKSVLESLKYVDDVIAFKDDEYGSCINALNDIKDKYPKDRIIFSNGGDRDKKNIPELSIRDVELVFGIGGTKKKNSSSSLLKEYLYTSEDRIWGKFFNLFQDKDTKVKELIINPGKGLSYQRHFHRSEIWFVSKGQCEINFSKGNNETFKTTTLLKSQIFIVEKQMWHQIINTTKNPCHIIEIQYGEKTTESDIERLRLYEGN